MVFWLVGSKESGPKGPGFGLPPEEASILLPPYGSLLKLLKIPNHKQITMTEIVRASLGLPTLRAGPQFQNPEPLHHLRIREFQTCFGHWTLEFVIYL
jgi:hypothetical protein